MSTSDARAAQAPAQEGGSQETLRHASKEAIESASRTVHASTDALRERAHASKEALEDTGSLRSIIIQTLVATAVVVGLVIFAATYFKAPLDAAAHWMVARFGLAGIVLGIAASDIFTSPIPPDTFLFLAATSDLPRLPTLALLSATSILCGSVSYFVGPQLQNIGFIRRRIERFRERGEALFAQWGVWAVAIGALSPLPYSVTCWFAGIYKMPFRRFFLATLFRAPRIIAYYYLFVWGWV